MFTQKQLLISILAISSRTLLLSLSNQLEDYHSFLVGYMGYTIEEVTNSMHLIQDHKTCVLKMLSLWRCKHEDNKVKTVGDLLSALKDVIQPGSYKVVRNVIRGKIRT